MAKLLPGQPILISEERRKALGKELLDCVVDLERQHENYFEAIRIQWRNYEAQPRQGNKDFPFKSASNVIIPLCAIQTNALVSRTWDSIFRGGHRVWQSRTENEGVEEVGRDVVRYINWQADDNDFNLKDVIYDWLLEGIAIGCSVIAGSWQDVQRHAFLRQGKGKNRKITSVPERWHRGPLLESVPRENILWDTRFRVADAPVVVRELCLSWAELTERASADPEFGGWFLDEIEAIKGSGGPGGPSERVRSEKNDLDFRSRTPRARADQDIREVHIDWPLLHDMGLNGEEIATPFNKKIETPQIGMVATIHRKTGRILRLIAAPYFVPYKPFFDIYYQRRSGRGFGVGVIKKLEHLQSGMTTIFNQGIDAQTRSNAIWAKTRDRRHLDQPIDPAHPIYDPSDSFETLNVSGNSFGNIQLLQTSQAISERVTGQADPAFGRETRMGGHPAPATSTLALMQQADTLTGPMRGGISVQMGRMGEFIATVNQQFEMNEDGKIERVLGDTDAAKVAAFLFPGDHPVIGNYKFNVRGISRDLNPDAELNKAVVVSQMNASYWANVVQSINTVVQLVASPQVPDEFKKIGLEAFKQFIVGHTEAQTDILEAADVDDTEKFILSINATNERVQADLRQFAGRSAQLAEAGGGMEGGNRQAPPGMPPGGAGAALGSSRFAA